MVSSTFFFFYQQRLKNIDGNVQILLFLLPYFCCFCFSFYFKKILKYSHYKLYSKYFKDNNKFLLPCTPTSIKKECKYKRQFLIF